MATGMHLAVGATLVVMASPALAQSPAGTLEARNEAIIRQHHDAINRGDIAAAAACSAEKVVNNGRDVDRVRLFAIMQDNARTFPDWKMTITRLVARGDEVAALMFSGRNRCAAIS